MSFKKHEKDVDLKVPKNNDVTNLPFAQIKMLLKNTTNLERQQNIIYTMVLLKKCPKTRAFAKRALRMFAAHW